jgi:hypothetical protein
MMDGHFKARAGLIPGGIEISKSDSYDRILCCSNQHSHSVDFELENITAQVTQRNCIL